MATVREIQVCGGRIHTNLREACQDYLQCLSDGVDRKKINFAIVLKDGTVKHITIRQEDDDMAAYGDFEGLPNFIEWAQGEK